MDYCKFLCLGDGFTMEKANQKADQGLDRTQPALIEDNELLREVFKGVADHLI